jgi:hypothetical protein
MLANLPKNAKHSYQNVKRNISGSNCPNIRLL